MSKKVVRIGVVGMGNAGMMHTRAILEGSVPRAVLAAASDTAERLAKLKETLPENVKFFTDYDKMLSSKTCDAVIVATPHLQHPEVTIKALRAGLHVFCEKPAGVSVTSAREMNSVAKSSGKVFAMNFNKRLEPAYQKLRSMVQEKELGKIYRIIWIATNWFRSDAYFRSSAWRGTWAGEGGGVMINQCIHELDIWQHIFGLPDKVRAFCGFGRYHDIEVEDDVTAYFEYKSGMNGTIISGTGETPGSNRIEVACSRGKLILENRAIKFYRTKIPVDVFNRENTTGFSEAEVWACDIPVVGPPADLSAGPLRNFTDAILDGKPVLVPGQEGLGSLEMENGILLSSWIDDWAKIPVDGELFDSELKKKIAGSKLKKKKAEQKVFDLKESFR